MPLVHGGGSGGGGSGGDCRLSTPRSKWWPFYCRGGNHDPPRNFNMAEMPIPNAPSAQRWWWPSWRWMLSHCNEELVAVAVVALLAGEER